MCYTVVGFMHSSSSTPERLLLARDTFLFLVMSVIKRIFLYRMA
jgi:hypothetical protein